MLSSVKFQALRGDGDESDGNFLQLLTFLDDDGTVNDWLKRKQNKYTSHEIQNELLKIMAHHVLRRVADSLQRSPFLTIMYIIFGGNIRCIINVTTMKHRMI